MSVNCGHGLLSILYWFCFIGFVKVVTSLQCYSCPSQNTAEGCKAITSCGMDQVCMLRRTINNLTQEIHYESKCEHKVACDLELDRYTAILTALVGRKREMKQVLAGDVCLIQCCDQDLCNNGCLKPTVLPVTATFMTNTMPTIESTTKTKPPLTMTLAQDTSKVTATFNTNTMSKIESTTNPKPSSTMTFAQDTSKVTAIFNTNTMSKIESTTNPNPASTMTFAHDTSTTHDNVTTRTPGVILIPTKPSTVTTTTTDKPFTVITTDKPSTTTTTDKYQNSKSTPSLTYTKQPTLSFESTKVTTSSISTHADCPYGTVTFDTSCYLFGRQEMSFHDAKLFCAKYNSHLVHVDSSRENEFLKTHLTKLHRGPIQYWIGITDEETEHLWRFTDNQKEATFYDWSPGEPDGTQTFDGNAKADCAVFDPFLKYQWRDEDCSPYQYSEPVCEMSRS